MKQNLPWNKLKFFYHVARLGSFTKAALFLNTSQSSLNNHILDLEERLKSPLFHRQNQRIILTERGEILFKAVLNAYNEIDSALIYMSETGKDLQGYLKITTTSFFSSMWIMGYLSDFLKTHPNLRLEIIGQDHEPDFLSGHYAEVALFPFLYDRPDLIQKYMRTWTWSLYASEPYLRDKGLPQTPEDLDNHNLIIFGDTSSKPFSDINWLLRLGSKSGQQRTPYLKVNSAFALLNAAESDLGIVTLSDQHVSAIGSKLVKVLPDYKGPQVDTYYIYPQQLKNSRKVLALEHYLELMMGLEIS